MELRYRSRSLTDALLRGACRPGIRSELDAPYDFRSELTPYARWGDWIAWLCVIAALVLLLLRARQI